MNRQLHQYSWCGLNVTMLTSKWQQSTNKFTYKLFQSLGLPCNLYRLLYTLLSSLNSPVQVTVQRPTLCRFLRRVWDFDISIPRPNIGHRNNQTISSTNVGLYIWIYIRRNFELTILMLADLDGHKSKFHAGNASFRNQPITCPSECCELSLGWTYASR